MRLPGVQTRLGLGVGLDLPWGAPIGFVHDPARGDTIAPGVVRFLRAHEATFSHFFCSFQPKNRSRLDPADYLAAYDSLFEAIPSHRVRALHQTTFNLGALEPYDRGRIIDFTNALIERHRFAWVNEDLGLWSLRGKPLPYPLPPYLTPRGLEAAVRNTCEVQRALAAPLLVEFPGFSEGTNVVLGGMHAYDFFARVVEDSGSPATLDTGHLLSYQWLRGKRGEALYDELDRLPLGSCFELHLSGCQVTGDRFFDHHHGILMDEQIELLARLLPLCPRLRAITYEDPRFDEGGNLIPEALPNFERLVALVSRWLS
jgi:hypothetical protein